MLVVNKAAVKTYCDELERYHMPQPGNSQGAGQMSSSVAFDVTRWRSFAERYLIERASTFEPGKELEGIWQETNNALTAYQHVYHVGVANEGKDIAIPAAVPGIQKTTLDGLPTVALPGHNAWYAGLWEKVHAW